MFEPNRSGEIPPEGFHLGSMLDLINVFLDHDTSMRDASSGFGSAGFVNRLEVADKREAHI